MYQRYNRPVSSENPNMNITFERAAPADAETMVQIQISAFHSNSALYPILPIGGPPGYDSAESLLKKIAENDYYKIIYEGKIVGGLVVVDEGQRHFLLDLIYIDPAYHNRGIGTRAMEFILQSYSATKWTLDATSPVLRNHHFYEKFGFVKVKEVDYGDLIVFGYEKNI
jgi:GNAT superfamily N-acetyltransferase